MVEQMTMFPALEKAPDKAPSNARVFHVKLSSNFQVVEFDVDVMSPACDRVIQSGVDLVNELGRRVSNVDTERKNRAMMQQEADEAIYKRQLTDPATKAQIDLLVRHLGGKPSNYAKWSKKEAWEKINDMKQRGMFNNGL